MFQLGGSISRSMTGIKKSILRLAVQLAYTAENLKCRPTSSKSAAVGWDGRNAPSAVFARARNGRRLWAHHAELNGALPHSLYCPARKRPWKIEAKAQIPAAIHYVVPSRLTSAFGGARR
jgi:hypothetical protein